MKLQDTPRYKFGMEGEKILADLFINKGGAVLPMYQFTNTDSAPALLTAKERIVLPDMLVCKPGHSPFWAEVKRYNSWSVYQGVHKTGVVMKHFEDYKDIREKTGHQVVIFFIQEVMEPTGIFCANLTVLDTNKAHWNGKNAAGEWASPIHHPQWMFPHDCLTLAWSLKEAGLE